MKNVLSNVKQCDVQECVFNADQKCHTLAINVGGPDPLCDTYMSGSMKGGIKHLNAQVGACKVADCLFNKAYECEAKNISVITKGEKAWCGSYQLE